MKPLAVITGASSGIGQELALVAARDGYDLLLVARRAERLAHVAEQCRAAVPSGNVGVEVLTADLSTEAGVDLVAAMLDRHAERLEVLANNAGFGGAGRVIDLSWERQRDMIALNITALARLSHHAARLMETRGRGFIMNVASTAAFQAGPLMAVYYASKAFVLHFSEAMAEEMKGTGVVISTLCPGPTESEFLDAAHMRRPIYFKGPIPTSGDVADWGWQAMKRGRVVAVHSLKNRILVTLSRLAPRILIRKITHYLNGTK